MTDERKAITDEDLAEMETSAAACKAFHTYCPSGIDQDEGEPPGETILPNEAVPRLVAEVRRLRSDALLERSAREIWEETSAEPIDGGDGAEAHVELYDESGRWVTGAAAIEAILRKHRDGKP